MKILRMKITPRPESGMTELSFYSCPDVKGDPAKTLAHIQRVADQKQVGCDYEICDERTYWAVRGARMWLISEPGDKKADARFRQELVSAGILDTKDRPVAMVCTGEDDHRVQVLTDLETTMIDTKSGEITVTPRPGFSPAYAPVTKVM